MNTEFKEKVMAVQTELKAPKGQYNKFGGYKYRSCEDILEAVKPLLKKHGLVLTISDDIFLVGGRYYVKATATLTDGTDELVTTAMAREEETKKGMDGSQITGASSSYARKYCLNGLFAIDDTKDSDVTNTHGNQPAPQTTPQPMQGETLASILDRVRACKTSNEVMTIWAQYPALRANDDFKNLVTDLGGALKAQEQNAIAQAK